MIRAITCELITDHFGQVPIILSIILGNSRLWLEVLILIMFLIRIYTIWSLSESSRFCCSIIILICSHLLQILTLIVCRLTIQVSSKMSTNFWIERFIMIYITYTTLRLHTKILLVHEIIKFMFKVFSVWVCIIIGMTLLSSFWYRFSRKCVKLCKIL